VTVSLALAPGPGLLHDEPGGGPGGDRLSITDGNPIPRSILPADFALRERSRPVTVAARRSFLWEREVTALSGPAAQAAAVGGVRLAGPVNGCRQDVVGPVVDGGAGQPLGAGLAVGTGAAAVLVNRSSVLGRVKWLFPGRPAGWDNPWWSALRYNNCQLLC